MIKVSQQWDVKKNILKKFFFSPHYLLVPVLRASLLLLLVLQLVLQFLDLLLEEVPLVLPIDSLLLDIKKKTNKQTDKYQNNESGLENILTSGHLC